MALGEQALTHLHLGQMNTAERSRDLVAKLGCADRLRDEARGAAVESGSEAGLLAEA